MNYTTDDGRPESEDLDVSDIDQYNNETFGDLGSCTETETLMESSVLTGSTWTDLERTQRFRRSTIPNNRTSSPYSNFEPDYDSDLGESRVTEYTKVWPDSVAQQSQDQQQWQEQSLYCGSSTPDFNTSYQIRDILKRNQSRLGDYLGHPSPETYNAIHFANLPAKYYRTVDCREDFLNEVFAEDPSTERIQVVLGKLPADLYLFNMNNSQVRNAVAFVNKHFPGVACTKLLADNPTDNQRAAITKQILDTLEKTRRKEMQYTELLPWLTYPLTINLPMDCALLQEVNRPEFYGVLKKRPQQQEPTALPLLQRHLRITISLRKLSPMVHEYLSERQRRYEKGEFIENILLPAEGKRNVACRLNDSFVHEVLERVRRQWPDDCRPVRPRRNVGVRGEGQPQPLEHLVTCVPGVEMVWLYGQKCIRKLELNKSDDRTDDDYPESPKRVRRAQNNSNPPGTSTCANKKDKQPTRRDNDQPITKLLTTILKDPANRYMTLDSTRVEFAAKNDSNLRLPSDLRAYFQQHVKHFQILGEGDTELITLSHRAQIKRICNDIGRLLRYRNPKCVSSTELPKQLMELWMRGRELQEFDVSHFGVCFLDDLMVTIPQLWGVHCSQYVSSVDGQVVCRRYGRGDEDVPDYVTLDYNIHPFTLRIGGQDIDEASVVHAWNPKGHHRTAYQQKRLAFLQQQMLNMFRGDPTANAAISMINAQTPSETNPCAMKRLETACLRYNMTHDAEETRRRAEPPKKAIADKGKPLKESGYKHHVPCDFELDFSQLIPTFHHVFNEQIKMEHYGAKNLFELFDDMADTFLLTHYEAQHAKIQLTAEARREVLERRLVHILRNTQENEFLSNDELMRRYQADPTMAPYFKPFEIERAARHCNLIEIVNYNTGYLAQAKPMFSLKKARYDDGPDVVRILSIFMKSFRPLTFKALKEKFQELHRRPLPLSPLMVLFEQGALRKTKIYNISADTTTYDLQDVCRIVRNLIYQMTSEPDATYFVPNAVTDRKRLFKGDCEKHSIHHLLELSGDCIYPDHVFDAADVMDDFYPFFKPEKNYVGVKAYKLGEAVIAGVPTEEDKENEKKKDRRRRAPQADNAPAQDRPSRGAGCRSQHGRHSQAQYGR